MNKQDDNQMYFEQYKMLVESAEKVSDKRMTANNFFLTVNTALISLFGLTITSNVVNVNANFIFIIIGLGIVVSIVWLLIVLSYKQLNSGKFALIHKLEKSLPIQLFDKEWDELGKGKNIRKYFPLSHIELLVPIIFLTFYIVLLFANC